MTIDYYEGYQEPKDQHAGYDPIIETMRQLHRIQLENWLATLREEHPNRRIVTEPVTSQTPYPD